MSETVALVSERAQTSDDVFAATAADRFEDAVVARGAGEPASGRPRLPSVVRRPLVAASILWLLIVVVAALWPAVLAPGDPLGGTPAENLQPPSWGHWFGTDQLGRDLYTRVVHGTALTVSAAAIAVGVGVAVGSAVGLVSGFVGGRTDAVLMRVADVLLAIPGLLLSLAVITALGFGTVNVAVAVGIASVASVARVLRSEVLRVRSAPYIEAARASGNGWTAVLLRHVLPNAIAPVLVLAVLEFGTAILAVSALSFLGYGAPPPAPEWGALVSGGRDYLRTAWWLTALPGLTIAVTVLAANRLSRGLDADGRARR
ncbi:ABC-type dipeptide/oligopeptide/nickel transport systems, permease components [Microbacterium testaceum StLB037]|uniref:ABC-type dipeptide/oligopeptide/nickel transport systems, permease components n=1 Tax=Microbacterium testaceum (strain StLB037) TaxID=979556 RepID=E8N731_MICTS|nr:ABC transporter permease [Microbacterium testaceum]BAJ74248.1 ABC-type dipeptide/oligopeptide/nickel transport systems, permease components [Microbacterium testaceum StLB037]